MQLDTARAEAARDAKRAVARAGAVEAVPALVPALADGAISASHANAIARVTLDVKAGSGRTAGAV